MDGPNHVVVGYPEGERAITVGLSYALKVRVNQRPDLPPPKIDWVADYANRPWYPFSATDVFLRQLPTSLPMGLLR